MIWKALTTDGKEILQSNNGIETSFWDLDLSKVESFCLIDSLQTLVGLDLSNGDFSLNNLDLTKLNELSGGESIELLYDAEQQRFKMSPKSLEFINQLILTDERSNYIGFDQSGKFNINGSQFYMGFEINGVLESFINQPPYQNIIQTNEAYTDFIGSKNNANPYKRVDATTVYNIGYTKKHINNDVTFNLSLVLRYDVLQKCVSVNANITSSETVTGKLVIFYGESASSLDVTLYKDEPANLSRIITIM
jgi:hypothetical protein